MKSARTITRPAGTSVLALTLITAALTTAMSVARADDFEVRGSSRSTRPHQAADGNLVDVQVKVEGRTAPLYFRPGTWDRHYFEALKGRNYSLVVHNNTNRRVGVLIAVDGLNVVNGERSNLSRNEAMYVLDPYEEADIRGWRTSLDEVRRFVFVSEERSYAERTGQANGDMGWIRVLSFREDEPFGWLRKPAVRERNFRGDRESNDGPSAGSPVIPAPSLEGRAKSQARDEASAPEAMREMAPEDNPGTGWGQRSHDRVDQTQFRAARQETDHLVLRYEYESGLRALNIFPARSRLWDRERGQLGFAKPPRW